MLLFQINLQRRLLPLLALLPGIDTLPQLRADLRVEQLSAVGDLPTLEGYPVFSGLLAVNGDLPILATTLDTALSE